MSRAPYDKPSTIRPVDGEVTVVGPGPVGVSITPQAARETARRLDLAADRAEDGHANRIDPDDAEAVALWAERLGVTSQAVRDAAITVGGDSEAGRHTLNQAPAARNPRGLWVSIKRFGVNQTPTLDASGTAVFSSCCSQR